MKLNFVYDCKSGDVNAPQIVPNHVVAIRNYSSLKDNKDLIFNKFPEDFELVTVDFDYSPKNGLVVTGVFTSTPFAEIVGDVNGK